MTPKTLLRPLITTLCVICLMIPTTAEVVIEVVDIPDENLRAAINKTLDKPTDASIDKAEILNLTKLNAEDIDIHTHRPGTRHKPGRTVSGRQTPHNRGGG